MIRFILGFYTGFVFAWIVPIVLYGRPALDLLQLTLKKIQESE
jgi:hypothetical protein